MRAIIVDDELPLLNEFKKILSQYNEMEIVGTYTNPMEAYMNVEETRPDIAFLDIEMAGLNGISLAEKLLDKSPNLDVIFVTAYNNYASEAFEANAIDYILKPLHPERLQKALEKLKKKKNLIISQVKPILRIQSFGKFGVYIGKESIKWTRAKQQELFAYFLQNEGQWVDKYKLCDDLWRDIDPEQALASLQTAIWAVRKVLKNLGVSDINIEFSRDSYILYLNEAKWDVQQFNNAYKAFIETGNIERCKEAVNLYGDGYLFNEDWLWSVPKRGKYSRIYNELVRCMTKNKIL